MPSYTNSSSPSTPAPLPKPSTRSQSSTSYFRLVSAISRLSEGEAACAHRRTQESILAAKLIPAQALTDKKVVSEEILKTISHQTKLL